LDKSIIGQAEAKKAVAVALRMRWRRRHLSAEMQAEVHPANILLIGPTGTGKTEVARRLAKLAQAPFVKVEATRYTEVGVYGANTDQMVGDLVAVAIKMEMEKARKEVYDAAYEQAEEEVLQALLRKRATRDREDTLAALRAGAIKEKVEVTLPKAAKGGQTLGSMGDGPDQQQRGGPPAPGGMPGGPGGGGPPGIRLGPGIEMFVGSLFGGQDAAPQTFKGTTAECIEKLREAHEAGLIDEKEIAKRAISRAEQSGIIFLDEIDKLASPAGRSHGLQHKTEGIQKELLGLVEGSLVTTQYGPVNTDHILFIASGAFHLAKPSDLLPELQGRLPIRVTLHKHSKEDLVKILTKKDFNLITQQRALIGTEVTIPLLSFRLLFHVCLSLSSVCNPRFAVSYLICAHARAHTLTRLRRGSTWSSPPRPSRRSPAWPSSSTVSRRTLARADLTPSCQG
jgi:ATP-dependent HslUV protease ATP-binding subunit HslU